jgi:hypothetical protein
MNKRCGAARFTLLRIFTDDGATAGIRVGRRFFGTGSIIELKRVQGEEGGIMGKW